MSNASNNIGRPTSGGRVYYEGDCFCALVDGVPTRLRTVGHYSFKDECLITKNYDLCGNKIAEAAVVEKVSDSVCDQEPNPEITSYKEGTLDGEWAIGETVTYEFVYVNTGTTTLTDIVMTDDVLSLSAVPMSPSTLEPGEQGTYSYTYMLTAADINAGEIVNQATFRGTDPDGNFVYDVTDNPNTPDPDDPTIIEGIDSELIANMNYLCAGMQVACQ